MIAVPVYLGKFNNGLRHFCEFACLSPQRAGQGSACLYSISKKLRPSAGISQYDRGCRGVHPQFIVVTTDPGTELDQSEGPLTIGSCRTAGSLRGVPPGRLHHAREANPRLKDWIHFPGFRRVTSVERRVLPCACRLGPTGCGWCAQQPVCARITPCPSCSSRPVPLEPPPGDPRAGPSTGWPSNGRPTPQASRPTR